MSTRSLRQIGLLIGLAALCSCATPYADGPFASGYPYGYSGYGSDPYAWGYPMGSIGLGGVWVGDGDGHHRNGEWHDNRHDGEWHHGQGGWQHEGSSHADTGGGSHGFHQGGAPHPYLAEQVVNAVAAAHAGAGSQPSHQGGGPHANGSRHPFQPGG